MRVVAPKKCLLSWSSGKDSAWALHALRRADVPVVGLLTTINQAFDRVAMHAVRRDLLDAQARSIGIPLWPVPLPWPCSNEDYERIMGDVCRQAKAEGIECVAFGDLFLPEVRAYRERQLEGTGLTPLFPLWGLPTDALAQEMLAGGLKARITCVDPKALSPAFAGREFDLVIADIRMQGMDGIELLEKIRAEQLDTSVIVMTGYASPSPGERSSHLSAKRACWQEVFPRVAMLRSVAELIR